MLASSVKRRYPLSNGFCAILAWSGAFGMAFLIFAADYIVWRQSPFPLRDSSEARHIPEPLYSILFLIPAVWFVVFAFRSTFAFSSWWARGAIFLLQTLVALALFVAIPLLYLLIGGTDSL